MDLNTEIKKLESDITFQEKCHREYTQDLYVYGSIANGYFYSSAFNITPEQAAKRVDIAEQMIPVYEEKLSASKEKLELLQKMAEVKEVA